MNNKGFMMVELVVVSSIVVVALTALYISFNKIMISYDEIIDYNDVGTTYRLGYYYKLLEANGKIVKVDKPALLVDNSSEDETETINGVDYKDIVYITNVSKLNELEKKVTNQTFKDFVTYVSKRLFEGTEQILVMESCQTKNEVETCKYAYMDADVEVTYVE